MHNPLVAHDGDTAATIAEIGGAAAGWEAVCHPGQHPLPPAN